MRLLNQVLSNDYLRVRLIKLGLFSAPLLAAYFYSHSNQSSPLFCPFRALTGIPCPACGLTRSFSAIATGNIPLAIEYHLFGPFVFLGFLIASIHLFLEIVTRKKIKASYQRLMINNPLRVFMLAIVMIYHGVRIYHLANTGELINNWQNSPLGKLL